VQMESVNATRVKAGKGQPVGWHIDSHPYPDPLPPLWYFPISVNCVYYLDEITAEKGPLVVVPGSHLSGKKSAGRYNFRSRRGGSIRESRGCGGVSRSVMACSKAE